jgi:hypothetical protein
MLIKFCIIALFLPWSNRAVQHDIERDCPESHLCLDSPFEELLTFEQFVEALGIHHDKRDITAIETLNYEETYKDLYQIYRDGPDDFQTMVHDKVIPIFRDASAKRAQGLNFWGLSCGFCESSFNTALDLVRKSRQNASILEAFMQNLGILFCRLGKFASKYTVPQQIAIVYFIYIHVMIVSCNREKI